MADVRTVRQPLKSARRATGFIGLKAVISFQVRDRRHELREIEFHVDSGTSVTSIPVATAERLHLRVPAKVVQVEVRTATGKARQRVRPAVVTVRVPGLPGREFRWPCHFVEQAGEPPPALLALSGVIGDLHVAFDGSYALEAPHGWLVLKEVTQKGNAAHLA